MSDTLDAVDVVPCCFLERLGVDVFLLADKSVCQLVCDLELLIQKLTHLRVETVKVQKIVVFPRILPGSQSTGRCQSEVFMLKKWVIQVLC